MTTSRSRRDRPDAPKTEGEPPSAADEAATRLSNGRFRKGHCPNPSGRPPKPKPTPDAVLTRVLDEEIASNSPGLPTRISVREALIRSACGVGLKDPRIALAILKLEFLRREGTADLVAENGGDLLAEEEAALAAYLAREERRSRRGNAGRADADPDRSTAAPETDPNEGDAS